MREGNQRLKLTKGHEALLAEGEPWPGRSYNKDQVEEDPLYRWSKLRSDYATQSNVDAANNLLMDGGWWGPGWYWDPFWSDFAFMPGFGIGLGSLRLSVFLTLVCGLCALLWFWLRAYVPHGGYGHFLNPEPPAAVALPRSPINPGQDPPDSTLSREAWRAVAWEAACRGVASEVVPWAVSVGWIPRGGFHGGVHGRLSRWWVWRRIPRRWLWRWPTLIGPFHAELPAGV